MQQQAKVCENNLIVARQQLEQMEGLGPDRPADLFAPVSIEIRLHEAAARITMGALAMTV